MRDVLRQMRPDRFEDLIAAVALYRPGPMANIPDYCRRKHGENMGGAASRSSHEILAETYGIMVYQEQVMQIAQKMARLQPGRRRPAAARDGQEDPRRDGGAARDLHRRRHRARHRSGGKATEVFDLMAKFADYGFNKSHAAAYGLVAYQTAWMKANHPEVFIAACMSLALGNTDRLAALREEATRSGIRILPPDINRSGADFSVERADDGKLAIRYALAAVKKVGFAAMQALAEARGDRRSPTSPTSPPASIRASSTACSSRT